MCGRVAPLKIEESAYKILGPSVGVLERVVGLVDDGRHALRIVAFPLQHNNNTANTSLE